jgi:hypothetical protein
VSATSNTTLSVSALERDAHVSSHAGELDRVRENVVDDLADPFRIELGHDRLGGQIEAAHQPSLTDRRGVIGEVAFQQSPQVDLLMAQQHLAALEPRQRQQIVDQRQQPAGVLVDDLEELGLIGRH